MKKAYPVPADLVDPARFAALHHAPVDGCWKWRRVGANGRPMYGLRDGRVVPAYRAAYALYVGPVPDGMLVCHRCDDGACVRPDHLFLGTNRDNMRDAAAKGRLFTGPRKRSPTPIC